MANDENLGSSLARTKLKTATKYLNSNCYIQRIATLATLATVLSLCPPGTDFKPPPAAPRAMPLMPCPDIAPLIAPPATFLINPRALPPPS